MVGASGLDTFWYELGVYFGLRDEDPEKAKAREAAAQAWERPSLGRIAVGLATLAAAIFFGALLWGPSLAGTRAWKA